MYGIGWAWYMADEEDQAREAFTLLEQVHRQLSARQASSPALALAETIGLGAVKSFWFSARLSSDRENASHVPFIQGSIDVDGREAEWFRVWVTEVPGFSSSNARTVRFGSSIAPQDGLGLGVCMAVELPGWLARAERSLGVHWLDLSPRTSLRGTKRAALCAWLSGGKG